jgi:hypothetical protein
VDGKNSKCTQRGGFEGVESVGGGGATRFDLFLRLATSAMPNAC